ncbi:hypothetical protein ZWY2020_045777 [Hordeum vulgare]|nr:hypothetical protein ZWY2020_045777 [Hordeum vulgare]
MDGDGELPFDFFSQTASSGAAAHHIDEDGWGMTPPRLRGSAGRGLVAGGLGRGSVTGGLGRSAGAPPHRAENIDLNADSPPPPQHGHVHAAFSSGECGRPWCAPPAD